MDFCARPLQSEIRQAAEGGLPVPARSHLAKPRQLGRPSGRYAKVADTHIDYFEVSEYTQYFVEQAITLFGASPLVNVEALVARVLQVQQIVEREVLASGLQRSLLRTTRGGITEAGDRMLDNIRRFHRYLQSLPPGTPLDAVAFFPNGYNGQRRKAADLLAQGKQVLNGFAAPANATVPSGPEWQASFILARDVLQQALSEKGSASRVSLNATSALEEARLAFLAVYNGMAKRLVRVVLQDVGREHEFTRFFRDLQVNEGGSRSPEAPEGPEAPKAPEAPGTPDEPALPGGPAVRGSTTP